MSFIGNLITVTKMFILLILVKSGIDNEIRNKTKIANKSSISIFVQLIIYHYFFYDYKNQKLNLLFLRHINKNCI